jgi:hypothetical protein
MDKTQQGIRALSALRIGIGVAIGVAAIAVALAAYARVNLAYSMAAPEVPAEDSPEAAQFLNLVQRLATKRTAFATEMDAETWKALVAEMRPTIADLEALASLPPDRLTFAAQLYPGEPSRMGDGMAALRNFTVRTVRLDLRNGECLHAAHAIVQALRISAAVGRTGNRDDVLQFAVFSQAFSGPLAWMVDTCNHAATREFLATELVEIAKTPPMLADAVRREWAAVARALDDPRWIDKLREDFDFFGMRPGHGELKHWTVWAFERREQIRELERRYEEVAEGADRPYVEVGPAYHDHDMPALVVRLDPAPEWREQAGRRGRAATRLLLVAMEMQTRAGKRIEEAPPDPLTGKPLLQRADGVWYSIGLNGVDDGGKTGDLYGEEGDLIYRDYRNGKPAVWTP